jgi:hypothetical protein
VYAVNLRQSQQGGWSFPTTKRIAVAFLAFFLLLAHFPVSESQAAKCADPSSTKSKCLSGKYKTTRALVSSTLKCGATAVRGGEAVDPECEQKTTNRFDAQWSKAEAKGDCLTTEDEDAVESRARNALENIQNQLGFGGPSKCSATKYKAVAALALTKAQCYAKAAAKGVVVNGTCLAGKNTKFASKWEKAENGDDCLTNADAAAIQAIVDGWLHDLTGALEPTPPVVIHIDRDPIVYTQGQQVARDIEVHTTGALQAALEVTAADIDPARVDPNNLPFQGTFPINLTGAGAHTSSIAFTPTPSGAYAIFARVSQSSGVSCPTVERAQDSVRISVRPSDLPTGIAENILRPEVVSVDVPAMKISLDPIVGSGQTTTLVFGSHQVLNVTISSASATGSGIGGTVPPALQGGSLYQGQIVQNGTPIPGSLVVLTTWNATLYGMVRQPDPTDPSLQNTLWVEPLGVPMAAARNGVDGSSHVAYLHSETTPPVELDEAHHTEVGEDQQMLSGTLTGGSLSRNSLRAASPQEPRGILDPDVYFGLADVYEHFVSDARSQQRLALFNQWNAILRSEFQNITPEIDPFPISVIGVLVNSWNTLPTAGYGSNCSENLKKFALDSGTSGKSQRLNILFTDKGTDCGGIGKLGQGAATAWPSLTRDIFPGNWNVVILGQEVGHNLDYHTQWSCIETNADDECIQRMTTDDLGGGSIGIAVEDDHLDVSEAWQVGFLPFFSFLSSKHCTIMRGSYDNCKTPEPRYHRNETRVLRHLAEGIIRTFIRD